MVKKCRSNCLVLIEFGLVREKKMKRKKNRPKTNYFKEFLIQNERNKDAHKKQKKKLKRIENSNRKDLVISIDKIIDSFSLDSLERFVW